MHSWCCQCTEFWKERLAMYLQTQTTLLHVDVCTVNRSRSFAMFYASQRKYGTNIEMWRFMAEQQLCVSFLWCCLVVLPSALALLHASRMNGCDKVWPVRRSMATWLKTTPNIGTASTLLFSVLFTTTKVIYGRHILRFNQFDHMCAPSDTAYPLRHRFPFNCYNSRREAKYRQWCWNLDVCKNSSHIYQWYATFPPIFKQSSLVWSPDDLWL